MTLYVLRMTQTYSLDGNTPFGAWALKYQATYDPIFAPFNHLDRDQIRDMLLTVLPSTRFVIELFEFVEQSLPELLSGRSAEDIFFAPSQIAMWDRYFNTQNELYQVNNEMVASAAVDQLKSGQFICEIGGGLGSAAATLADRLDPEVLANTHLTFTDVVPIFLTRARRALANKGLSIKFERYDFNQEPQFTDPDSFEFIYAVNALHVAFDLEKSLGYLRNRLQSGGALVLVEAIRPQLDWPIYPEFVFGFFRDFHHRKLSPQRPKAGFLDANHWVKCLKSAGFSRVDVFPNIDLNAYPFVITARFTAWK